MERLVLTARLRDGARERASALAADIGTDPGVSGFEQLSVFLSESEVIFLLEANEADDRVRAFLNDPVRATELSPWLALFDGPLHRSVEIYHWSRRSGDGA